MCILVYPITEVIYSKSCNIHLLKEWQHRYNLENQLLYVFISRCNFLGPHSLFTVQLSPSTISPNLNTSICLHVNKFSKYISPANLYSKFLLSYLTIYPTACFFLDASQTFEVEYPTMKFIFLSVLIYFLLSDYYIPGNLQREEIHFLQFWRLEIPSSRCYHLAADSLQAASQHSRRESQHA